MKVGRVGGPSQGLGAGVKWMMDDGDHPWVMAMSDIFQPPIVKTPM